MDAKTKEAQQDYQELVKAKVRQEPLLRHVLLAFLVGGALCILGQLVLDFFTAVEGTESEAAATTLAVMIFVGAFLTALGIYDELGEWAGAGAAVPITGFSNTVAAAAMDFRREGLLLGMGAKMFIVAGPVLVYGILAGFLVGLIRAAVTGLFP